MATSQTTYDEAPAIGLPGQVANEELANVISRTVESAAGIAFGQPAFQGAGDHGVIVGGATTGTAVAAAQGTNTGNGTFGAITVGTQAQEGVYTVEFNDATHFVVSNPEGEQIGHGTTEPRSLPVASASPSRRAERLLLRPTASPSRSI
jgi:hypothetical protein